ncbi:hypothetical protein BRADI_1g15291v3 [Brachypodium distachyon]|uniref:Secreted protein n=1 Tax=Brachypodium distachyon TaxID=15368 RepID=A0A2K2DJL8_BRADI|nr:hypothetical protein BRADI_1g15291v3 [Brachypodium distachyon]
MVLLHVRRLSLLSMVLHCRSMFSRLSLLSMVMLSLSLSPIHGAAPVAAAATARPCVGGGSRRCACGGDSGQHRAMCFWRASFFLRHTIEEAKREWCARDSRVTEAFPEKREQSEI